MERRKILLGMSMLVAQTCLGYSLGQSYSSMQVYYMAIENEQWSCTETDIDYFCDLMFPVLCRGENLASPSFGHVLYAMSNCTYPLTKPE